jgi:hypothetical protein
MAEDHPKKDETYEIIVIPKSEARNLPCYKWNGYSARPDMRGD